VDHRSHSALAGGAVTPDRRFSRAQILVLPGEWITCPYGHPFGHQVALLPSGLRQCRHVERRRRVLTGPTDQPCPEWLWIWSHGDGSHTVVWLEPSEADTIQRLHMAPERVRDYLGLTWPARQQTA